MSLKPSLSGAPPAELENMLSPLPAYRARQIFAWITRGARSFDMMNDLPLALRRELDGRFCLRKTAVLNTFYEGGTPLSGAPDNGGSNNGAAKLQISVDGGVVEAVALADGAFRRTACLSAQLGCPEACVFCKTGSMGFIRNLDSAEIIEQF
jgi:23S rRNA (adenine2503-C2)-methyltransferase